MTPVPRKVSQKNVIKKYSPKHTLRNSLTHIHIHIGNTCKWQYYSVSNARFQFFLFFALQSSLKLFERFLLKERSVPVEGSNNMPNCRK